VDFPTLSPSLSPFLSPTLSRSLDIRTAGAGGSSVPGYGSALKVDFGGGGGTGGGGSKGKGKESLKRALTEMHRVASLLLNFQMMNRTGFAKLTKKMPDDMATEVCEVGWCVSANLCVCCNGRACDYRVGV
jgi:hypothetical protein